MELLESKIEMALQSYERHQLTEVCRTEKVEVYRCGKPGTRTYSFQLSFTPEGIAIQGDSTPEPHGSTSYRPVSLEWFTLTLEPRYLAGYFLTRKWCRDNAKQWLERKIEEASERVEDLLSDESAEPRTTAYWQDRTYDLRRMRERDQFADQHEFVLAYETVVPDHSWSDDSPWDYQQYELATLVAIQQTFRRLWRDRITQNKEQNVEDV